MRLIDADALIDIFEDRLEKIRNRYGDYSGEAGVCAGALHLIRVQPTIEPERKTGKWIHIRTEADGNALYECSECHMGEVHVPIVEVRYCWNCGAKMDGSE